MLRQDRRVVVTGLGLVTPLGIGIAENWEALMTSRSGVGPISRFDASALPVRIAAEVRNFDPARFIERKEIKRTDRFVQYALAAAQLGVDDAELPIDDATRDRIGVVLGVGMGGIETIEEQLAAYFEGGFRKLSPFFVPRLIANMAPGQIAMHFGVRATNYATVSACASSGHSIGEAFRAIRHGYADAVIAGGTEACVTPTGVGGFAAMRALSTRNDEPERASRPFEKHRDGFVIGEGAGILILEDADRARHRGARIYAEVIGYGSTADAHHITAPAPAGEGAVRCMLEALTDAQVQPTDVDYVNAHGTSTPANDITETVALKRVFGEHAGRLLVSSTKSQTGHLLGGAGGVEAAYTALALERGVAPATINFEERDPECDLDYVPNEPRRAPLRIALSNSFGFGGANACILMRRWDESE
jgi:3-oxoacyl-[acyl-carrier-protein] synthase II